MIFIFDFIVLILIKIDIKRYKTIFTPFIIISLIYCFLININNLLICNIYNFYKISDESLLIFLLFLGLMFFISYAFSFRKHSSFYEVSNKNSVTIGSTIVQFIFYIGLAAYLLSMLLNIREFGFSNIKGNNNGILGHLSSLGFLFAPLLVTQAKNRFSKVISNISVVCMFVIAFIFGGKYVIFINVAYFLIFLLINKKVTFKRLLIYFVFLFLCGLAAFVIIYFVVPLLSKNNLNYSGHNALFNFAVEHFFYYLLSPVIGCNYAFQNVYIGNGIEIIFTVPINICKAILGNGDYSSHILNFVFEYSKDKFVNVAGLIGESVYCLGLFGAILYFTIVFSVIYCFYTTYRKNGKYKLTTCYLLGVCSMLFFANFFTVSGVVLPLIFLVIFESFISLKRGNYAKKIIRYYS